MPLNWPDQAQIPPYLNASSIANTNFEKIKATRFKSDTISTVNSFVVSVTIHKALVKHRSIIPILRRPIWRLSWQQLSSLSVQTFNFSSKARLCPWNTINITGFINPSAYEALEYSTKHFYLLPRKQNHFALHLTTLDPRSVTCVTCATLHSLVRDSILTAVSRGQYIQLKNVDVVYSIGHTKQTNSIKSTCSCNKLRWTPRLQLESVEERL